MASPWASGLKRMRLSIAVVLPPAERFTVVTWYGFLDRVIPWLNLYLHSCEGDGDKNMQLLIQAAAVIKAIDGPFIASGDWQLSPEVLRQTGLLDTVHAATVAPKDNTYFSGDTQSKIDHLVLELSLMKG